MNNLLDSLGIVVASAAGNTTWIIPICLGCVWYYFRGSKSLALSYGLNATQRGDFYPGLYNLGNTCFLNSTVQSLASLRLFNAFLLDQANLRFGEGEKEVVAKESGQDSERTKRDVGEPDNSFTSLLFDLCVDLNTLGSRRSISPYDFISKLQHKYPRLLDRDQQDAHEFFQLLSNIITDELRDFSARLMFRLALSSKETQNDDGHRIHSDNTAHLPPFRSPFTGLIASRMTCRRCFYASPVRHATFDNLSLTVGSERGIRIHHLLDAYMSPEYIDGWLCAKCTLKSTIQKLNGDLERLEGIMARSESNLAKMQDFNDASAERDPLQPRQSECDETNSLAKSPTSPSRDAQRLKLTKLISDVLERIAKKKEQLSKLNYAFLYNVDTDLDTLTIPLERVYSKAVKETRIAASPPILVLHMQRSVFTATGHVYKNSNDVFFDSVLDISLYVTAANGVSSGFKYFPSSFDVKQSSGFVDNRPPRPSSTFDRGIVGEARRRKVSSPSAMEDGPELEFADGSSFVSDQVSCGPYTYSLSAVVLHFGSHDAGHFTCLRSVPSTNEDISVSPTQSAVASSLRKLKGRLDVPEAGGKSQPGREWLSISDHLVSHCTLQSISQNGSPHLYMLFYERIDLLDALQSKP